MGVRLDDGGRLHLHAPFGVDDILAFRVTPNRTLDNALTHRENGDRARRMWPQVSVEPW